MDSSRHVDLTRIGPSRYRAVNERGTQIELGDGSDDRFTPVELLLVALAGCTAITADPAVSRRAEPTRLDVHAQATKIRDDRGSRLVDVTLAFDTELDPAGDVDAARRALHDLLHRAETELCTVSRTVDVGTPTSIEVDGSPLSAAPE